MLRTKSILAPKDISDGVRISVMSRHTLNDGKTPHPQITSASYDEWLSVLAPSATLIGDYYKRGLPWEHFEQRYNDYLRQTDTRKHVQQLAERSLETMITLLCIEETPDYCHRRLLANECTIYQPSLILDIQ